MVRAGLVAMIYRQTTLVKAEDLKNTAAITLMNTDVERIVSSFRYIHETWGALVDVAIALWLLERQLFLACLVPAVIGLGISHPECLLMLDS
jgi:ATP-binding cassette subfamily C (CFTR/MRP) protein 1